MEGNRGFNSESSTAGGGEMAGTTIVGARPLMQGTQVRNIPRGIEVLLKKASLDAEFRSRLLRERSRSAQAIGLKLEETEADILEALPENSLQSMINKTMVPTAQQGIFRGYVAALMLAAVGVALAADAQVVFGITPDQSAVKPTLKWQGKSFEQYAIYTSDDLAQWQFVATVTGKEGALTWTDLEAYTLGLKKRFYKIQTLTLTDGITPATPVKIEISYEKTGF
jgi:hypothetical protein